MEVRQEDGVISIYTAMLILFIQKPIKKELFILIDIAYASHH